MSQTKIPVSLFLFSLIILLLGYFSPAVVTQAQDDESRILFSSKHQDVPKLYTMRLDGSDIQYLGDGFEVGGEVVSFRQSPDQAKIAYIARKNRDGVYPTNELFVYDLQSGANTQITNNGVEKGDVNWLPDSTTLVYLALGPEGQYDEIRSLNLTSGKIQTLVTAQSLAEAIGLEMVIIRELKISPDGTKLVGWVKTGLPEVYSILIVMDVDDTNIRQLTANEEFVGFPVWGLSNYIYFVRTSGVYPTDKYSEVNRLNLDTMAAETVVSLQEIATDEKTRNIIVLDVTPDERIIWQLVSSQNLYVYDPVTNQVERYFIDMPEKIDVLGVVNLRTLPSK
ncbi:MAG TPA: hypothetical protein VHO69_13680 [Phototrophicaceae bacterium]|nr:hypothetical protein [Phototrophicaceae bacterium]